MGLVEKSIVKTSLWFIRESQFKKGDNLIFAAFGGGFTFGAGILEAI